MLHSYGALFPMAEGSDYPVPGCVLAVPRLITLTCRIIPVAALCRGRCAVPTLLTFDYGYLILVLVDSRLRYRSRQLCGYSSCGSRCHYAH